jgi:hypothetical protein
MGRYRQREGWIQPGGKTGRESITNREIESCEEG